MEELIIDEAEILAYQQMINQINVAIEQRLSAIITQVSSACGAFSEGYFHDNLDAYVEKLKVMQGQLAYFTFEMQGDSSEFMTKIDEIDTLTA